ncbi:putative NAD dependent epimerase/dehydratase family protein [Legionella geestiana]|uniref:Putative NAD dependent epimerase/dehydratase family protein n=1 Tax=Legionella geestiana TaxID=45065 RepID=A0A0W0TSD4_9GAMM|nr:SDR family oxidoreductase [Legionella geestiana]KTC98525.1 putative NAD dependent epimerase/dehydratase family protein [Legionella geestiana]QBS13073.1 SDR family oxidoreductase [Legionella geestiana]STX54413.1 putative NAD dependent epimerase/dehydratase family protein [Legionella geestiana]
MTNPILITGANGFVGEACLRRLLASGVPLRAALRSERPVPDGVESVTVGDIGPDTDWKKALAGCEAVIHTAARVHVMREQAADPLAAFRRVNVEGTLNLARQAADAGVSRFIFLSSIKVNGESTLSGHPFRAEHAPNPLDPYGQSKWEAEQGLFAIARETGMEAVIIRPPLVYGPRVKGNFRSMLNAVQKGIPLPLGGLENRRSLVFVDNLADLIRQCLTHPRAANAVFLVSDGEDVSTSTLLMSCASAMKRRARLFHVPQALLFFMARLLGREDALSRLCGSLQVDIESTCSRLNWTPPVPFEEALKITMQNLSD